MSKLLNSAWPRRGCAVHGRRCIRTAPRASSWLLGGRPTKNSRHRAKPAGGQRLNVHGRDRPRDRQNSDAWTLKTVDAASTIRLLQAIEAMYPLMAMIHVFLDNARYPPRGPRAGMAWRIRERRIKLHFVPAYCPHLNPIERLVGRHAQASDATTNVTPHIGSSPR